MNRQFNVLRMLIIVTSLLSYQENSLANPKLVHSYSTDFENPRITIAQLGSKVIRCTKPVSEWIYNKTSGVGSRQAESIAEKFCTDTGGYIGVSCLNEAYNYYYMERSGYSSNQAANAALKTCRAEALEDSQRNRNR